MQFRITCLAMIISLSAYTQTIPTHRFNKDSLEKHIITLSSDAFEGRKPGTNGETKTVEYLEKSFKQMGIEPGNAGSYFQDVSLVDLRPERDSTMTVATRESTITFKSGVDYILWTEKKGPTVSFTHDQMAFVGYGIVAPEYNWDDYAGMDVKGKIVLVMENEPQQDDQLFKGPSLTWYGIWRYKVAEAARHGAKGCLIINRSGEGATPFSTRVNSLSKGKMFLDIRSGKSASCEAAGFITEEAALKILSVDGKGSEIFSKAAARGFRGTGINAYASTKMTVKPIYLQSKNVIAKITGTEKPDEYIVYTAHWDHMGIGKPDKTGDAIYNGALDDAAGTAELLELARAFKREQPGAKRSIIFLATTAEEEGLLGSEWYTTHPIYPLNKTLVNINLDGFNPYGYTKDVWMAGIGLSNLDEVLAEETAKMDRYISDDPDAGGVIYRSDQLPFMRAGVPAIFTGAGSTGISDAKTAAIKKLDEDYGKNKYHQPADQYDPKTWDIESGLPDLELLFRVGLRLANSKDWPQWKDGAEFKATREKSLKGK